MKQRVLRYDEDILTGMKNFKNFALFCIRQRRKEETITNEKATHSLWYFFSMYLLKLSSSPCYASVEVL